MLTEARRRGTSPGRSSTTSTSTASPTSAPLSSSKTSRNGIVIAFALMGVVTLLWLAVPSYTPGHHRDDRIFFHGGGYRSPGEGGPIQVTAVQRNDLTLAALSSSTVARYTVHIATDKPVYRLGDTIYWRASVFDVFSRAAPPRCSNWQLEIKSPRGDTVHSTWINGEVVPSTTPPSSQSSSLVDNDNSNGHAGVVRSTDVCTVGGSYVVPKDWTGGEYIVKIGSGPAASSTRNIQIRGANYRTPRLNIRVDFVKKGYGAGDEAMATVTVRRAEGGIPTGATVTASAIIDGKEVWSQGDAQLPLTQDGHSVIRFTLPTEMSKGEGTLNVVVTDGGIVESSGKTIPILLQTLDVHMYPEGGQLVAGVPNTVYVEAHTPTGDPADFSAELVLIAYASTPFQVVATVSTVHEGRGSFTFTPQRDAMYQLRFLRPSGIKHMALPDIHDNGVTIHIPSLVQHTDALQVHLNAVSVGTSVLAKYLVNVYHREKEVLSYPITIDQPTKEASTIIDIITTKQLPDTAVGVLRVTIIDFTKGVPVAERLVYRPPANEVNVDLQIGKVGSKSCNDLFADASPLTFAPGEQVKLCMRATDRVTLQPVDAIIGVTVSDHSLMETIEQRRQPPRLQSMVWLEHEVKQGQLMDSNAYFAAIDRSGGTDDTALSTSTGSDTATATVSSIQAIDLLLATQGWRRFAYGDIATFKRDHPNDASRMIAEVERAEYEYNHYGSSAYSSHMPMAGAMPRAVRRGGMMMEKNAEAEMVEADGGIREPMMAAAPPMPPVILGTNFGGAIHHVLAAANSPILAAEELVINDAAVDEAPAMDRVAADDVAPAAQARMIMPEHKKQQRKIAPAWDMPSQPVLRVYAHQAKANRLPNVRDDFTDTVYWNTGLRTNHDGTAEVLFTLSDSITSFHVYADAFAALKNGVFGSSDSVIVSREPFYVETKLPNEISSSDKPIVPVIIVNASPYSLQTITSGTIVPPANTDAVLSIGSNGILPPLTSSSNTRARQLLDLHAIHRAGSGSQNGIRITSAATGKDLSGRDVTYKDSVTRYINVVPDGFPVGADHGGMVDSKNEASWSFELDQSMVAGSANLSVRAYPSPAANLLQALAALIREPYGCFEQTSSTTYPLVMAQQYFKTHSGVDPELIRRSDEQLQSGYKRLISYETKEHGFEWFGSTPPHEALTAYGLLQFIDMAKVMDVDQAMVKRTRDWLVSRKNQDGSAFLRSSAAIDSFGRAPDDITNAYIVWSLTYAGETDLGPAIEALVQQAKKSSDPYFLGLVAGILYNVKRAAEAKPFADKLITYMHDDGSVAKASTSITGSQGDSLLIETTSISVLTWMNDDSNAGYVERAMRWLASRCKDGKFGSTQGTVLALKAIISYDLQKAGASRDGGSLQLYIDGKKFDGEVPFDKSSVDVLVMPDVPSSLLPVGKHRVQLKMIGGAAISYSMSIRYYSSLPSTAAKSSVLSFTTKLLKSELKEGSATQIVATISNSDVKDLAMTTAIIGIPGGMELRHDQLRELVDTRAIAFYEIIGRDLVIYWRGMKAGSSQTLRIDVTAAIPGYFKGPASRAYLYYNDEHKAWSSPLSVTITPST